LNLAAVREGTGGIYYDLYGLEAMDPARRVG
jgi:hypothetical protein